MGWAFIFGWVLIFGTICALIGPRKGKTPLESFIFGAVFGIFAVVGMALMQDVDPHAPPPLPPTWGQPQPTTRQKVYRPGQEEWFRQDQADAIAHGWYPVTRDFDPDGSLRVTYAKRPPSEWAS